MPTECGAIFPQNLGLIVSIRIETEEGRRYLQTCFIAFGKHRITSNT